ncbi:MAG: hypothetical protein WBQ14_08925 [Gaiellaceae bacterium]
MRRTLSALVALLAIAVVAGCGSTSSTTTTSASTTTTSSTTTTTASGDLVGTVGPGFTITLTSGGAPVKTLAPGTYRITVTDKASIHNFHLFGPGVNKATSVPGSGTFVWTVKLVKGSYTYQCDVHFASGMIGHFVVG